MRLARAWRRGHLGVAILNYGVSSPTRTNAAHSRYSIWAN